MKLLKNEKYKCENCGCKEFISQLNKYDIYEVRNNKIALIDSEHTDEKIILYCRDCSKALEFDENDIVA